MIEFHRTRTGLLSVTAVVSGPTGALQLELAVDTGATRTLIDRESLRMVGLDPMDGGARTTMSTPHGSTYSQLVNVPRLQALGQEQVSFAVLAHDVPPTWLIDGLLGLDFLARDRLVVDFLSNRIELT